MAEKIEWHTKLGATAQTVLEAANTDQDRSEYSRYAVKHELDKLMVTELRDVSAELAAEEERLEKLIAIVGFARTAVRREAGI